MFPTGFLYQNKQKDKQINKVKLSFITVRMAEDRFQTQTPNLIKKSQLSGASPDMLRLRVHQMHYPTKCMKGDVSRLTALSLPCPRHAHGQRQSIAHGGQKLQLILAPAVTLSLEFPYLACFHPSR